MNEIKWLQGDPSPDEPTPLLIGWYPVLHEWEAPEGFYPIAGYWDEKTWRFGESESEIYGAILWLDMRQETKCGAIRLAHQHDLNI